MSDHPVQQRAALAAACEALTVATLVYVAVSRVFFDDFHVGQEFGADRVLLIVIATLLVVARRLAGRGSTRVSRWRRSSFLRHHSCRSCCSPRVQHPTRESPQIDPRPDQVRAVHAIHQTYTPRAIHRLDDRYGLRAGRRTAEDSERGRGFTAHLHDRCRWLPHDAAPRATSRDRRVPGRLVHIWMGGQRRPDLSVRPGDGILARPSCYQRRRRRVWIDAVLPCRHGHAGAPALSCSHRRRHDRGRLAPVPPAAALDPRSAEATRMDRRTLRLSRPSACPRVRR